MAKPGWPPPAPWQPIPGIVRLIEKGKKKPEGRFNPNHDELGRFAEGGSGGSSDSGGGSDGGSGSESGASSSGGFQEITASQITAEGVNSRAVSGSEFQSLAAEGQQQLTTMAANSSAPDGLDKNWGGIKSDAYTATQASWGGATYDAHTGQAFTTSDNVYALSVRPPGVSSVTVAEGATPEQFGAAMDTARAQFADQLSMQGGALGVFHDDTLGKVEIDPVITVGSMHEVETIGAYTHAVGGAYNFADGNGYWPPHVADAATVAMREAFTRPHTGAPFVPVLSRGPDYVPYRLPAQRFAERKKKHGDKKQRVIVFDYDETITKAPDHCAWLSVCYRAASATVYVLTGNASPRHELEQSLADIGFEFDELIQYHDSESSGIVRAHILKELDAWLAVDNRIDRSPTYTKVCPHLFLVAHPDDAEKDNGKGAKKAAKQTVKQALRSEFRGPPRIPTNYGPNRGTPATHCGNCDMYWQGQCWGFGNVRVDPVHGKCDEWTPDTDDNAGDPQEGSQ